MLFDEFHERHLYGDITLARALQIQETTRPDLMIIVMSATLDVAGGKVSPALRGSGVRGAHAFRSISSISPSLPVTRRFGISRCGNFNVWCATTTRRHALFSCPALTRSRAPCRPRGMQLGEEFVVFPLHGELPPNEQDAAVARYERRKIVVATNVAETSLTIDGVRLVIDSGLARIPRYDPYRGINTLLDRKNQPRGRRSKSRPRRPDRTRSMPATRGPRMSRSGAAAGTLRSQTSRLVGGHSHAQGERVERCEKISLVGSA